MLNYSKAYYILGMSIGSLVILIVIIFLFINGINNLIHKKKIKFISLKSEIKINSDIKVWAKQTKNLFIANAYFNYKDNKFFKVDSILITSKALIIIEIKSIKGIIKGNAEELNWLKNINDKNFYITNPIIKNEKNIEHLVKITNIKVPTISLVIFSNSCQYIKVINNAAHTIVIKHSELFDTLDKINESLNTALSEYEKRTIYRILKSYKNKNCIFNKKNKLFFKKGNK